MSARERCRGILEIENGSEVAVGAAQATIADTTNVTKTGLLTVGGIALAAAAGSISAGITVHAKGQFLGNAAVGGAAGSGAVTVGESATDASSAR